MKFMKPCRTDLKILFALQQDMRTYAGNSIYVLRLQVNVGDRLAKSLFYGVNEVKLCWHIFPPKQAKI